MDLGSDFIDSLGFHVFLNQIIGLVLVFVIAIA